MDELLHFIFWEIVGNLFFRTGRLVLRGISFGSVRLENPTRFQMFVVSLFGLLMALLATLLLLNFALGWVAK